MITVLTLVMLVLGFLLGLALALVGLGVLLFRKSSGSGMVFQFGEKVRLETKSAALATMGLGVVIVLSFALGGISLSRSDSAVDQRDEAFGSLVRLVDLVSDPLASDIEASPANEPELEKAREETLDELTRLVADERYPLDREVVTSLLSLLSRDSFGLVEIDPANVQRYDAFLQQVLAQFPGDAALHEKVADLYRSLHYATGNERFLREWGEVTLSALEGLGPTEPALRSRLHQLAGLYYQAVDESEKALDHLELALELAAADQLYKVEFNLCRTLHVLGREESAMLHCEESHRLATEQGRPFWQPLFLLALIECDADDRESASAHLLEAVRKSEVPSTERRQLGEFVASQREKLEALCIAPSIATVLPRLCNDAPA